MEKRIAEIFLVTLDKEFWEEIEFKDIKRGHKIRLFDDEERKEPVLNADGTHEFIATSDAYETLDAVTHKPYWTVSSTN